MNFSGFYKTGILLIWGAGMLGMAFMLAEMFTTYQAEGMSAGLSIGFGLWFLCTAIIGFAAGVLWRKGGEGL